MKYNNPGHCNAYVVRSVTFAIEFRVGNLIVNSIHLRSTINL